VYPLDLENDAGTRIHRWGSLVKTVRSYDVMLVTDDVTPQGDAFPHFLGVHAYVTTMIGDPSVGLDLRFNNGPDDFYDQFLPQLQHTPEVEDDILGRLYFDRIDLYLLNDPNDSITTTWNMRQQSEDLYSHLATDPPVSMASLGGSMYDVYPIVKPVNDGLKRHIIDNLGRFHRRLVVFPDGQAAADAAERRLRDNGLAFVNAGTRSSTNPSPLWSWFEPSTARYFPQKALLPDINYSSYSYGGVAGKRALNLALTDAYENLRDAVADPAITPSKPDDQLVAGLGWANPMGGPDGGGTSGNGIVALEGWRTLGAQSLDGWRRLMLRYRLLGDRQDNSVYDTDGEPSKVEKWLTTSSGACSFCPDDTWRTAKHTLGKNVVAGSNFAIDYNFVDTSLPPNAGVTAPDYATELVGLDFGQSGQDGYKPIDDSHLCRISANCMALVWIGNDSVAKDDLRMLAEMGRLAHSRYPHQKFDGTAPPNEWSFEGGKLYELDRWVAYHPGFGFKATRAEGWVLQVVAGGFSVSSMTERLAFSDWFDSWLDVAELGMLEGVDVAGVEVGSFEAENHNKFYGSTPVFPEPRARQVWEEMILDTGLRSVRKSYLLDVSMAAQLLDENQLKSYQGLITEVTWPSTRSSPWAIQPLTEYHVDTSLPGTPHPFTSGCFDLAGTVCVPSPPNPSYPSISGVVWNYTLGAMAEAYELDSICWDNSSFVDHAEIMAEAESGEPPGCLRLTLESWIDPTDWQSLEPSGFTNAAPLLAWAQLRCADSDCN